MPRKQGENPQPGGWDQTMCADRVKSKKRLETYLCTLAKPSYQPANAEVCRTCESQCAFGRRFVEMTDAEKEGDIQMPRKASADGMTAQESIAKLNRELAEERKKRKELESRVAEMGDDLQEARMLCDDLETANQKYQHEIEGNAETMARLRVELAETEDAKRVEEDARRGAESEVKRLEAERCELVRMNRVLADVNAGLEAEVMKLRKQLEEERAGHAEMEMKVLRMKGMVFDAEHPEVA